MATPLYALRAPGRAVRAPNGTVRAPRGSNIRRIAPSRTVSRVLLNRSESQFWLLQTLGWLGYLALSLLAAFGYGKPESYYYVPATASLAGFVITCGLRYGYRAIWNWP